MFHSTLKTLIAATAFGAVLATGVAASEATSEDVAAPPAGVSAPHHRKHRGPIDLAKAAERAAQAFEQVDTNADGQITEDEFASADGVRGIRGGPWGGMHGGKGKRGHGMHGLNHEPAPFGGGEASAAPADAQPDRNAQIFASLDSDGNGQVSAEEFARIDAVRRAQHQRAMFGRMDANGDGFLSKDEFPPFTARLKALDVDQDGQVTREEMRAKRHQKPAAEPAAGTPPAGESTGEPANG